MREMAGEKVSLGPKIIAGGTSGRGKVPVVPERRERSRNLMLKERRMLKL